VSIKASDIRGFLIGILVLAILLGVVVLRVATHSRAPPPKPTATAPQRPAAPLPVTPTADCSQGPAEAAARNAASLQTLTWSPFGRPEIGWET